MKRNGTIHITANDDCSYTVTWSPVAAGGGQVPQRIFRDHVRLRQFLGDVLGIDEQQIMKALQVLNEAEPGEKRCTIPEVWLSDEEARQQGLTPR